jgi:hypothetical protein
VSFAINKAMATVNVTGYCSAFDSSAHTATGTATGVLSETLTGLGLSTTTHTAGGTYASDPWNFTNQNYANQNGTVGDSIVDTVITAPTSVAPNGNGTASVPDAGAGATYTWSADNAIVSSGAGTHSINFTIGTVPATLHVTVLTTTGCSKTKNFEVNAADPSEVPTLSPLGLALLAALLAFTGAIVVARQRRTSFHSWGSLPSKTQSGPTFQARGVSRHLVETAGWTSREREESVGSGQPQAG